MENKNITFTEELRRKAEERVINEVPTSTLSDYDTLKLLHELQVYQLELEMQNDELLQSKEELNDITEKFNELYESAPMGFFTLTKGGEIVQLNRNGSKLFNTEPTILLNTQFSFYVMDIDKPAFNHFLEKIFESKSLETCIVNITLDDIEIKQVLLSGVLSTDGSQCLLASINVSK